MNAIESNFRESMDKHSLKHTEGIGGTKIFSYADRKALVDFSSNLSNFIKENYSDVRMVKDITTEQIQAFLNDKAKRCSTNTLEQYTSKLRKLEQLVNKTYNVQVNYRSGYVVPLGRESVRTVAMSTNDYSKLLKSIKGCRSQAVNAVKLAGIFGLRVSETVNIQSRDIKITEGIMHIHQSKGGRSRDLTIPEGQKQYLLSLKASVNDCERVVKLKENSVNKFLNRQLNAIGLAQYTEHDTGIHAIRKMVAQQYYDKCREGGQTIQQALNSTSVFLGHGEGRNNLMKHYLQNIK